MAKYEELQMCCMWSANFEVQSDNSANTYLVQFHKLEPASCTCPAYKYSGEYGQQTCKHIKRALEYGCFAAPPLEKQHFHWDGNRMVEHGVTILNFTNEIGQDVCTGCGLPTVTAIFKKEGK